MPKIKTRKTAIKRFKITGTGKLMRRHTRRGHLMINKDPNRKRGLRKDAEVVGGDLIKTKRLLPNSF
jgi:large subunit ribosomal protein L35